MTEVKIKTIEYVDPTVRCVGFSEENQVTASGCTQWQNHHKMHGNVNPGNEV